MKILHCCLASFYIDDYSYQENVLPKLHKQLGHEVMILASTETYMSNRKLGYISPSTYFSKDGIEVKRIPYVSWLPMKLAVKIRKYVGVLSIINDFKPDLIFLHDTQTYSTREIARYLKQNKNVKLVVDCHADYINSARGWVSKHLLHKIYYKWCAKQIIPFIDKFYGTLPIRINFPVEMYGIPKERTSLLPFGIDPTNFDISKREEVRKEIRTQWNIQESDFVIIAGGKIDKKKNIHLLVESIINLKNENVKLFLFGEPVSDFKKEFSELTAKCKGLCNIGWIDSKETYKYFVASDLVVFPGTHSVLWEETIGLGLPGIFKKWDGMDHVDLGGNVIMLEDVSVDVLYSKLHTILNDSNVYASMLKCARDPNNMNKFNYLDIARRSIEF